MYGTEQQINNYVLIEITIWLIQINQKNILTESERIRLNNVRAIYFYLRSFDCIPPPNVQKRLMHYAKYSAVWVLLLEGRIVRLLDCIFFGKKSLEIKIANFTMLKVVCMKFELQLRVHVILGYG